MKDPRKAGAALILMLASGIAALSLAQTPPLPAQASAVPLNLPSIKKWMSREEFSKAGLSKLNEAELKALDAWLQKYSIQLGTAVIQASASVVSSVPTNEAIETQIEGTFTGWSGDTICKMVNGQIWQQSTYAYHYHYAYRPDALIYRSGGGWKMKIDGADSVWVKLLR